MKTKKKEKTRKMEKQKFEINQGNLCKMDGWQLFEFIYIINTRNKRKCLVDFIYLTVD